MLVVKAFWSRADPYFIFYDFLIGQKSKNQAGVVNVLGSQISPVRGVSHLYALGYCRRLIFGGQISSLPKLERWNLTLGP